MKTGKLKAHCSCVKWGKATPKTALHRPKLRPSVQWTVSQRGRDLSYTKVARIKANQPENVRSFLNLTSLFLLALPLQLRQPRRVLGLGAGGGGGGLSGAAGGPARRERKPLSIILGGAMEMGRGGELGSIYPITCSPFYKDHREI